MRLWTRLALTAALALGTPVVASAQYRDLDTALSNLVRGFGDGDTQAIIAGMSDGDGDKVQLQFPGLVEQQGFFGRDQATYILEQLFAKAKPTGFVQQHVEKVSTEAQYQITGQWTIAGGARTLYITLRNKNDKWSIVSLKSAGK
jgi:Domain of unknown function (DUF4783)